MAVFLFDEMIFGPVRSRRLGVSLGLNLLPTHKKVCSFNCIYCECGWTESSLAENHQLPSAAEFEKHLSNKLMQLKGTPMEPDSLTFAGNGEPTIHPDFAGIIDLTLRLRNEYAPNASISVLTNGSMLHKPLVVNALKKVDNALLKLDGGTEATIRAINAPPKGFRLSEYVHQLKAFDGKLIIQSLFLRGTHNHVPIDNTTSEEVEAWLKLINEIRPSKVMVYAIERDTPANDLVKLGVAELESIAYQVRLLGIPAEVFA